MSSSDDEDDKFLYGSDSEQADSVGAKRASQVDNATEDSLNKRRKLSSDVTENKPDDSGGDNSSEEGDSDEGSSESESDSDVEFIISTGADTSRLDSKATSGTSSAPQTSGIAVATTTEASETANESATLESKTTISTPQAGTIDLDAEGLYEGEPVTSLDPEVLKEKPWRQPGANLSDYFNYGFNEFTWMEYLHRQEKLQQEYNPHKILMGLLTLQQQGNLGGPKKLDQRDMGSSGGLKTNTSLNQHVAGHAMPPPGFPPLPMFGGFSPFPMPGMMPPMNPHQQKK